IYNVHTNLDMQNQAYPTTTMRYTKDFAVVFGGAMGVGKRKDLRLGASMKWLHRVGSVREVRVSEITGNRDSLTSRFGSSGNGIAGDVGMQYRLPTAGRTEVTTSFVYHDIGKTSFGTAQQQDTPTRIEENMVVGLGVRFPIGGTKNRRLERRYGPTRSTSHLSFAFDYSHLNYSWDREQLPKHLHFGVDLEIPLIGLQIGINQSSLTLGTSFDIGVVRVGLATYGEEMGNYAGQRVDRRYVMSIGSGFEFKGF
ncbi:MAG TPA: hypothetical protein VIH99_08435, partial [Bdellovibrionota bacterium]